MVEYIWKDGARVKWLDAQTVGEHLDRLQQHEEGLTPDVVVQDARRRQSPLHGAFEWDDAAAAHQHRLETARSLIRSVSITFQGDVDTTPKVVRAFLHTGDAYEPTVVVLSSVEKRSIVVTAALSEFNAVRRKYHALTELAAVYAALDEAAA